MKGILTLIFFNLSLIFYTQAQDLYVYHGRNNETSVYTSKDAKVSNYELKLNQGKKFHVQILNANPILYKYTIKFEEQKATSEDENISAALLSMGGVLTSRLPAGAGLDATPEPTYETYKNAVNAVLADINLAQTALKTSDFPEAKDEAFTPGFRDKGLMKAIDVINGLPSTPFHFNSATLTQDLKDVLAKVVSVDDVTKKGLELLNNSLVQKVKEIKELVPLTTSRVINNEFILNDKVTKVYLIITPVDATNSGLVRDLISEDKKLEIATISPYYKRAVLELVPVGTFIITNDVKEFYLDNNIIKSREQTETTFTPSVVINANVATFGPTKEMAAGFGLGYKLSDNSKVLNSLFISSLFSYKDFLRVGVGFGLSKFPHKLKGANVGDSLPSDVTNLADIIEYKDKAAVFFNIAFTGLSLTKKK